MQKLKTSSLLLSLPISFVGIFIYLSVSDFYALNFKIGLETIGFALIFIRIFDILQDLLIGNFSDQLINKGFSRKKLINIAATALIVGFFLVFNPPILSKNLALIWLVLSLVFTYFCFNFTIINFEATIALLAKSDFERASLNSRKEFLGLIGLILAFLLPTILQNFGFSLKASYMALSLVFLSLVLIALFNFKETKLSENYFEKLNLKSVFAHKEFRTFLLIFFISALASAFPAANLIFFVRDVLKSENQLGYFLSIYFLSAALSTIFWKNFAQKNGLIKAWIWAISGSVFSFYFAYFLDENLSNYFYLICAASGFFLGGDLILPPSLIAKISEGKESVISSYFALWNMVSKIALMLAASISLIVLGALGYSPGVENSGENIVIFYAAIPCFLKIIAGFTLIKKSKTLVS
jgi:Na+/melibiose symporter-like transporter